MNLRSASMPRIGPTVVGDAAVPRRPQVAFLVPVVALVLILAALAPGQLGHPSVLVGLGLAALATAVGVALPRPRLHSPVLLAMPVLDLAAVAALRLTPDLGAVGALVVFPAMWLGATLGRRGVVITTVASIALLTVPGLLHFGSSPEGWSRAVLLPTVAFVVAATMCITADMWRDQRRALRDRSAELAAALNEITTHRQLADAIVRTVDVGLVALDADGHHRSMNPAHEEIQRTAFPAGHGGRAGQVGEVFAADNATRLEGHQMPSWRASHGEEFSDYHIWIGADPETRRALSVSARPVVGEHGEPEGAVLAYQDITDLMRALRVKDDFVTSISHELRTPLTSIIGYVDLLADSADQLPEDVNHYVRVTRRNADRLLLLVSDLLSTAQVEAGAVQLSREPVDLAHLVRLSVASADARLRAARLRMELDLAPVPSAYLDPGRVTQVVDNLLSNAIKYTEPGGTVRVGLCPEDGAAVLTVRDTGIGISEEDQRAMFTKFFRASAVAERAIPGAGLGLGIARAIVEAHGGAVEVDSELGIGTAMRVRLPLHPR